MAFRWPWRRREQPSAKTYSVSDPELARILGWGWPNYAGVEVTESSALALSAVYRAVALISGTLAAQPMRTGVEEANGLWTPERSFLDTPGGQYGPTPFEWKETVLLHLLLRGNAFLQHIYGGAGQLVGLRAIHPAGVHVEERDVDDRGNVVVGGKQFQVRLAEGGTLDLDARTMTHIPSLSLDGVRGMSVIEVARNSLGTSIAGDRAAAKLFSRGALVHGVASADEDIEEDDAKIIKDQLRRATAGWENNGAVPFINRKIKFSSWAMSAEDAQFLQSRSFQVEEIARWFGVPPHLLMQTEKQTSWGQGVAEQNRGLGRFTLNPWSTRIEERLSRLVRSPKIVRFDYSRLERPNPETQTGLAIQLVQAKIITPDEGRAMIGRAPMSDEDRKLITPQEVAPVAA